MIFTLTCRLHLDIKCEIMGIDDIFAIIDIFVNYKSYEDILEKAKNEIINTKSEQKVKDIVVKYKKNIDHWYIGVIIKSALLLLVFIVISYVSYLFCLNNNVISIFIAIITMIVVFGVCIIAYIIDKLQRKSKIKMTIYDKLDETAEKNGIKYLKIQVY